MKQSYLAILVLVAAVSVSAQQRRGDLFEMSFDTRKVGGTNYPVYLLGLRGPMPKDAQALLELWRKLPRGLVVSVSKEGILVERLQLDDRDVIGRWWLVVNHPKQKSAVSGMAIDECFAMWIGTLDQTFPDKSTRRIDKLDYGIPVNIFLKR